MDVWDRAPVKVTALTFGLGTLGAEPVNDRLLWKVAVIGPRNGTDPFMTAPPPAVGSARSEKGGGAEPPKTLPPIVVVERFWPEIRSMAIVMASGPLVPKVVFC